MNAKEIFFWWRSKWIRYNVVAILSGVLCMLTSYVLAIYFKRPFYFFFMLPSAFLYLIGLNIFYFIFSYLYSYFPKRETFYRDTNIKRNKAFNILSVTTVLINILLLVLLLLEFRIFSSSA
jgi:hypothetical protein